MPSRSYASSVGAVNAARSSCVMSRPSRASASSRTWSSTLAACWPPITLIRAFGHIHSWRGEYARPHMP